MHNLSRPRQLRLWPNLVREQRYGGPARRPSSAAVMCLRHGRPARAAIERSSRQRRRPVRYAAWECMQLETCHACLASGRMLQQLTMQFTGRLRSCVSHASCRPAIVSAVECAYRLHGVPLLCGAHSAADLDIFCRFEALCRPCPQGREASALQPCVSVAVCVALGILPCACRTCH